MIDLPSEQDIGRAIAIRLRAARLARGLSQARLGAALGVSFQQIQKYERASNRISAGRLLVVSRLLHVPLLELYGEAAIASEPAVLSIRDPMALDLARLAERLSAPRRLGVYRLVQAMAEGSGETEKTEVSLADRARA
jgi:transcriptional regulator with XRE-family HTH domain